MDVVTLMLIYGNMFILSNFTFSKLLCSGCTKMIGVMIFVHVCLFTIPFQIIFFNPHLCLLPGKPGDSVGPLRNFISAVDAEIVTVESSADGASNISNNHS